MKKFILDFIHWKRRGYSWRGAWDMADKTL